MAEEKKDKKTDWLEWRKKRIGGGENTPLKTNLIHSRIAWCNAFDRGDQYKILNELTGKIEDVYTTRETRCLYNMCKAFNDAYAAKMLKGDPIPSVTPFSTNTEDYDEDLSMATNGAVENWWKVSANGSMKLRDTTRSAAVGGIAWAKVVYDKNKRSGIYDGEVIWEKINSLHAFPNADATCDEEIREFIHRFPKEKSVAEEEFAEQMKAKKIDNFGSVDKNSVHPEIAEASKKVDSMQNAEVESTIIQDDIWIRACAKYPRHWIPELDESGQAVIDKDGNPQGEWAGGQHVIMIGDNVLIEEECKGPDVDSVPFKSDIVNPLDGQLAGLGVTYPIIPLQRDMNKLNSITMENAETMGHLKWIRKEGSVTLPGSFDDMSGEFIDFTGDYAPTQSACHPLPQHITGRYMELFGIMKFITGLQDIGFGLVPRGGSQMAAGTTNELKNSEEVRFAPDIARMVEFVQWIIRRYLANAKYYYKEERIITIIGENKRPEAVAFFAQKLKDNYNIDIKVGSGFSRSDEAQVTAITNLMQTPAFDKAGVNPRLIMEELLRKQGLVRIKEDTFKDERQAKRYLDFIINNPGQEYPINRYVNPNAHIKIFTDYTKLEQFDSADALVRGAIEAYIDRMVNMTLPPPQPGGNMPPGNLPPLQSPENIEEPASPQSPEING
jgi:hypothetical protein